MTASLAAGPQPGRTWKTAYDDLPEPTSAPEERARAVALVESICGVPDKAAIWAVDVIHAQAAALTWVRDATGFYPSPPPVADRIAAAAAELRAGPPRDDPTQILAQVARDALRDHLAAKP
jgi:hypothetical protein